MKGLHCLIALAALLAFAGCDHEEEPTSTSPPPEETPFADEGCEDVDGHPVRASQDAKGYVIACLSEDETSLHVRNVSSSVLMVRSTPGVNSIESAGVGEDAGTQAALYVTGNGWTASGSHFVLALDGALIASGPGPAVVNIEPHLSLSAQANSARYVADWATSVVQTRGRALARQVYGCATTAAGFAETGVYVEDVLRGALGTAQCTKALSDALLAEGRDPAIELPKARSAVLKIAQPVAEDRLIAFLARVL